MTTNNRLISLQSCSYKRTESEVKDGLKSESLINAAAAASLFNSHLIKDLNAKELKSSPWLLLTEFLTSQRKREMSGIFWSVS